MVFIKFHILDQLTDVGRFSCNGTCSEKSLTNFILLCVGAAQTPFSMILIGPLSDFWITDYCARNGRLIYRKWGLFICLCCVCEWNI